MNVEDRIKSLGSLHDTIITSIIWSAEKRRLIIEIDDLNTNTDGLPEYPGPIKGTFVFSEVTVLELTVDLAVDGLMVYDWTMSRKGPDTQSTSISLSPGGQMIIDCLSVEIAGD